MNTLSFEFSDIPLLTIDNLTAGYLEGEAEISYDAFDGQWTVREISIWSDNAETRKKELVKIEPTHPGNVFATLYAALTGDKGWTDAIDDAVAEDMHAEMPWPAYAGVAAE